MVLSEHPSILLASRNICKNSSLDISSLFASFSANALIITSCSFFIWAIDKYSAISFNTTTIFSSMLVSPFKIPTSFPCFKQILFFIFLRLNDAFYHSCNNGIETVTNCHGFNLTSISNKFQLSKVFLHQTVK